MARPATAAVRLLTGEREPCRLATTANIILYGLQTIDAVAIEVGDRVLVKNQADQTQNGIYTASEGQWSRAADARTARTVQKGTTVHVQAGATNAGKTFVFNTDSPVVGDTAISIGFYISDSAVSDAQTAAAAAASSASTASTSATNAASSASAASTSATNAGNAATAASGSATSAATNATNAGNSATAAASSASSASTSATNAGNSATAAVSSATAAANSASTINLPAPVASTFLQRNAGNTAYDTKTVEDISATLQFKGAYASPAARTIRAKMQDRADLRDWNGLDLTDINDNATLLQAALNATAAAGEILYIPSSAPGGAIALGSQITWPAAGRIQGNGQAGRQPNGAHSYFHITHTGIGFKTTSESISDGQASNARSMRGVNFRRNQPTSTPGWTPTGNGYDVQIFGCYDVTIEDCMFLNPTQMIQIVGDSATSRGAGRVTLRDIKGQPIVKGIDATNIYDGCFFDSIHLWPFWTFDTNITNYIYASGTAFNFGRADNLDLGRMFAYGYQLGMGVYQQATVGAMPGGSCNYLGCETMYTDGCSTGLLVTGDNVDLTFGRYIQAGMTSGPVQSMRFFGNNGRAYFSRLSAIRSNVSAIYVDGGTNNLVTVGDYDSLSIDADASGEAEFLIVGPTNTLRLMNPPKTSAALKYAGSGTIITPDFDTDYRSVLSADRAGADVATVQNVFGSAVDEVTLLAATAYEFEAQYELSRAAGTNSHTFAVLFGGTATFTSIDYVAEFTNPTGNVAANAQMLHVTAATAAVLTPANTSATEYIVVKLRGEMRINAAGTVIPQFQYSAAPGGAPTIKRNSFFNIKPIGTNAMVKNGPWT